jgi:hypothetical protein
MKMKPSFVFLTAALIGLGSGCRKSATNGGSAGSSLLSLETRPKGEIAGSASPAAVCAFIKEKGYFPSNSYASNTKVLFSSSYEIVENSAGQGFGVVGSDGYFVQQGNTTNQLLLCPGASSISGGKCAWKINGEDGYAQLAFDVVCNKRSRGGSAIHPGYTKQSARQVSYVAETAGKSVSGQDAVEVVLESRTSKARIVFAKGIGLVATVFQESLSPAGTAEVFIGGSGTGFLGE